MNNARSIGAWMMFGLVIVASSGLHAEVVNYTLENVILDDGNAQMFGDFTWTYDVGDFENGVGQFTFLDIPFTAHDHTDLDWAFDIGNSIEITLAGSVHDDGVDITLFLTQPLTPTTGTTIDLDQSRYEIGGNGFHTGLFVSGSVVPAGPTGVEDPSTSPGTAVAVPAIVLTAHPNPFNPRTTLSYDLPRSSDVSIAIHDLAGRVVRTLVANEHHAAGHFEIDWNGRSDGGRFVPSAVYVVRMQAGDEAVSGKLSLLK